jgi:hypothetical protein
MDVPVHKIAYNSWGGAVFVACMLAGSLGCLSIWECCHRAYKKHPSST